MPKCDTQEAARHTEEGNEIGLYISYLYVDVVFQTSCDCNDQKEFDFPIFCIVMTLFLAFQTKTERPDLLLNYS